MSQHVAPKRSPGPTPKARSGDKEASLMRRDRSFLGRGWAFLPSFSAGGAEVEMASGAEDIHQSLQILLSTSPGERIMQESFGCDLASVVFEPLDQGLATKIERLVRNAIVDYEPRVHLDGVSVAANDEDPFGLLISIHYTVRATNSRFNMVVPFYRMEPFRAGS